MRPMLATLCCASFALPFVCVVDADAKDASLDSDRRRLQGTWKVSKIVNDGEAISINSLGEFTLDIEGDSIFVNGFSLGYKSKKRQLLWTYDLLSSPKHVGIDLVAVPPQGRERFRCLLKFDKDGVVICGENVADADRPADFSSVPGSKRVLILMRQQK
ncbi:TIGR03067 domain-containing protein [Stieleria sp. JC731]|uniref:TIGR03067 domain-containing protein n=1 Tax=Pirellulaceae TaxID=2691357 RepID=UPI001E4EBE84|nr:TIGR03067 domain-containing protein [Stieleria sp. JC731]MCC9603731.1 TIGR03067 domain-containing protein [Stieleria sp. JC731]